MAFKSWCDNEACGAEIEASATGRPMCMGKRELLCPRCFAMTEAVETQLRVEATEMALTLAADIDKRRAELRAQYLAPQVFPAETAPDVPRGPPARGEWRIEVPA